MCAVLFTDTGVITSQSLGIFCWILFLIGITCHTKNNSTARLIIATSILTPLLPPSPKSNTSLPVFTIMKDMKEENWMNKNTVVWYVVTKRLEMLRRKPWMEEARGRGRRWWDVSRMWWGGKVLS